MQINKKTKTKDINKNGSYYRKGTQIFFDNGGTNHELMAVATDNLNAKQVMTALNVVENITNEEFHD